MWTNCFFIYVSCLLFVIFCFLVVCHLSFEYKNTKYFLYSIHFS